MSRTKGGVDAARDRRGPQTQDALCGRHFVSINWEPGSFGIHSRHVSNMDIARKSVPQQVFLLDDIAMESKASCAVSASKPRRKRNTWAETVSCAMEVTMGHCIVLRRRDFCRFGVARETCCVVSCWRPRSNLAGVAIRRGQRRARRCRPS